MGTRILPAGCPDENVYVPWVLHTAHKLLTPVGRPLATRSRRPLATRSGDPLPPGQSPEKFVYVYHPGRNYYKIILETIVFVIIFVIITKIMTPEDFLCNVAATGGSLLQGNKPRNLAL